MIEKAAMECASADIIIIIGTSMQVYPAASLYQYAPSEAAIYYIDPKASENAGLISRKNFTIIEEKATTGMAALMEELVTTK